MLCDWPNGRHLLAHFQDLPNLVDGGLSCAEVAIGTSLQWMRHAVMTG
jgi:hypothetical protein